MLTLSRVVNLTNGATKSVMKIPIETIQSKSAVRGRYESFAIFRNFLEIFYKIVVDFYGFFNCFFPGEDSSLFLPASD